MIQRTTWENLIQPKQTILSKFSSTSVINTLLTDIDALYVDLLGENTEFILVDSLKYVYDNILKDTNDNIWKNLPVWTSSYRVSDLRPIHKIISKVLQYAGFYKKVLTDGGFAKNLTIHREYENASDADTTNKGYNSETPQITLDNFDDAIKYASSLEKGTSEQHTENDGESTITTNSRTFEEAIKNTKMLFFNELVDYILNIPILIYHEYSLETYPVPEIVISTLEGIKQAYEQTRNRDDN